MAGFFSKPSIGPPAKTEPH